MTSNHSNVNVKKKQQSKQNHNNTLNILRLLYIKNTSSYIVKDTFTL